MPRLTAIVVINRIGSACAGQATRQEETMSEMLLFSPMTIRGVTLKNRIVVPPMHQYSAEKGFPTDWHLMNAGKFAAGGAGLVVVESTKVERRGCGTVGDLGIWDDKLRRTARPPRQIHQAAEFGRRHPARPFRPQGARDAALGGRPPAAANARDRGLGCVDAGGAERDRP